MNDTGFLFLHGIGNGPDLKWVTALSRGLRKLGYPALEAGSVCAPNYIDLLAQTDPTAASLPSRSRRVSGSDRERERLNYAARQSENWFRLSCHDANLGMPGDTPGVIPSPGERLEKIALRLKSLQQARRYVKSEDLRAAVLGRVLDPMAGATRWVVVGHSLGSVVALDLITHLPDHVEVALVVTLASPLARPVLSGHVKAARAAFPHERVGGWLNCYNVNDVVSSGVGVSTEFPEAIDVPVNGTLLDHGPETCLSVDGVVDVIGRSLVGSLDRELAPVAVDVDRHWDAVDLLEATNLQYGLRTLQFMEVRRSEKVDRYRVSREMTIADLLATWRSHDRVSPIQDPRADLSAFVRGRVEDQATFLTYLSSCNPLAPYEIRPDPQTRRDARRATASDFGLVPAHVELARGLYLDARDSYKGLLERIPRAVWPVLMAAGVVAAVAAPYLIVVAAPAGLAGAAAITAGLAALGPGGMMGGLMVIGTVAGVGGLSATTGAVGSRLGESSPDQFQQSCIELMARAAITKRLELDALPGRLEWEILSAAQAQVAASVARLALVSDPKSATLKSERHKEEIVSHALSWMVDRWLGPQALASEEA